MTIINNRVKMGAVGIAAILSIPLIAMQFSSEVKWTFSDFIIAAFLLTVTGLFCELLIRLVSKRYLRYGLIFLAILILAVVWAELAVGVFGSPFAGS
ncbi:MULTISPECIES: hypothetical protein [Sphingobacterium]|uniref:hypothetical protein n=1 Tax=Sphingobacterium TaxID=28453 RepID=UPI0013DB328B|nr:MULTISPECIES: hypothetical protein [unclassified Sphingobacterium]